MNKHWSVHVPVDGSGVIDLTGAYGPVAARVGIRESNSAVLFMESGEVRFAHDCKVIDAGLLRCAPALQIGRGHEVVTREPLTIVASIHCPDCGLHGFVTDGRWVGA